MAIADNLAKSWSVLLLWDIPFVKSWVTAH